MAESCHCGRHAENLTGPEQVSPIHREAWMSTGKIKMHKRKGSVMREGTELIVISLQVNEKDGGHFVGN